MRRHYQQLSLSIATMTAILAGGGVATSSRAQDHDLDVDVFFELNDTDGDLGIQAVIDGDAWRALAIETPRGRRELSITLGGAMRRQGLTELFFESDEPNFSDLSPAQFFRRFPAGTYVVHATSIEGEEFEMGDMVTQLLPAPPEGLEVNGMELPEDCDQGVPALSEPFVVSWDPVTMSHPDLGLTGRPIEVVKYQAVLEREDEGLILTIDLPPDVTEVEFPAGLAEPGDEFKVEVLVKEASGGNQTAIETCGFEVE